MDRFTETLEFLNGVIWHDYVLLIVLGVGVLFTVWSGFGQYRALTHGVAVIRGKYDDARDPGAINHFQALSTALSGTVGLGNIAGVAIAVSLGGPGAVFWMWIVGIVGMCLKMTEVTQSMLYRNTSVSENPRGGPMWVCKTGLARFDPRLSRVGTYIGGAFCLTLLVSTITGGNMFQAWNVADISFAYFGIPQWVTGLVLTVGVGLVIVGGIKRIGDVTARIVPFMCGLYLLAGLYVIFARADEVPAVFALIVKHALSESEAGGAFIGGTAGYAFLKGMQRALFSNEAGQGSAPIAHSAAKTDEPVREGVVAGLEPFVDTLCVCTITALVILLSGAWNREPALAFVETPGISQLVDEHRLPLTDDRGRHQWLVAPVGVTVRNEVEARGQLRAGNGVFIVLEADTNDETGLDRHRLTGELRRDAENWLAVFPSFAAGQDSNPTIAVPGAFFDFKGATLTARSFDRVLPGLGIWVVPATVWLFAFSTIISWSYYGEQGITYLLGPRAVFAYRISYCLLIPVTAQLIGTQHQLDLLSTFGTGLMLWANIPIMLIFGPTAMRAYRDYFRRYKAGAMQPHRAPRIIDIVGGKNIRQ
jgi:AGCS family alanine or glycine:cation symporter